MPDPAPELVTVAVSGKDVRALLVEQPMGVRVLDPQGPDWVTATAALAARRWSPPDRAGQLERWANSCRTLHLSPAGPGRLAATTSGTPAPRR